MTKHIGIVGPIGAGKSTLASMLHQEFINRQRQSVIVPLAAEIKSLVERMHNAEYFTMEAFNTFYARFDCDWYTSSIAAIAAGRAFIEHFTPNEKPRKLYQIIGTEVGRSLLHTDVWLQQVQKYVQSDLWDYVITDDVRFDNEARAVDILIRIDTDSQPDEYKRNTSAFSANYLDTNHASENGITVVEHFVIPCGFSQEQVQQLVERIDT